ncbi:unnamed protein product [Ectocarpus sp. 12 AP-2014]
MASLRSAMFAGYNKFDDANVRIGSWREELAMKELTGVTRLANPRNKAVFNATDVRVLYHADKPGAKDAGRGKSESHTSYIHPEKVAATKERSAYIRPGPRAVRSQLAAKEIVLAEEKEREALEREKKKDGDFDTTFRQSYKRYSDEASRAAKQDGVKPQPQKAPQAPTPTTKAFKNSMTTGGDVISEVGEVGHYSTGTTVTLWNTGGMAPGGTADRASFGRTSRFTEPGVHPSFFQEVWPGAGPHHASLPGGLSDLEARSLMFLKKRVIERAQEKPLPSVRGLWRLLWPRTYVDAVGKIGPAEFREGMAEFEVPVTKCEVWVVTAAFGTDKRGQICLDKLMHFFRAGGLSEARRKVVHELFRGLDSANTGAVPLSGIRAACDFSSSPAVIKGKACEEEITTEFLQHLQNNEQEGLGESSSMITAEHFQDAFRDIGTACTSLVACSWEAASFQEEKKDRGHRDTDADGDVGEELFMGVVSSVGG